MSFKKSCAHSHTHPYVQEYNITQFFLKQVLVAVKAAGVNPVDAHVATSGEFPGVPPPPFTLGYDGAGVVEAVGDAVTKFKVRVQAFYIYSNNYSNCTKVS